VNVTIWQTFGLRGSDPAATLVRLLPFAKLKTEKNIFKFEKTKIIIIVLLNKSRNQSLKLQILFIRYFFNRTDWNWCLVMLNIDYT
jgi:hypothetical protein